MVSPLRGVAVVLLSLCWTIVAGCTIESPIDGRPVNAQQLANQYAEWSRRQEQRALQAKADADMRISQARQDAELALARLKSQHDLGAADVQAALNTSLRLITAEYQRISTEIQQSAVSMKDAVAQANERLERQWAALNVVLGVGTEVAEKTGFGPVIPIATSLMAALGIGYGAKKRRDAARASDDALDLKRAIASVVNGLDVVRARDQQFAQTMRDHKATLLENFTERAIQEIDAERLIR